MVDYWADWVLLLSARRWHGRDVERLEGANGRVGKTGTNWWVTTCFVTNVDRLQRSIDSIANAIHQGEPDWYMTETIAAVNLGRPQRQKHHEPPFRVRRKTTRC
jgi:hypothetical protein